MNMTGPEKVAILKKSRNHRTGIRVNNARRRRSRFRLTPRQMVFIFALLFLYMGTGISYVWSTFEKTQIGYDLSQLKKEELRLKEIGRKLRLELAFLKSPENLESLATKRFGLRQPSHEQIVVLP